MNIQLGVICTDMVDFADLVTFGMLNFHLSILPTNYFDGPNYGNSSVQHTPAAF